MASGKKPSKANVHAQVKTNTVAKNLDQLKAMVANATDFSEPMYFFMDHLVPDDRFMDAGAVSQNAKVTAVFRLVCEMLYQQEEPNHTETVRQSLIIRLKAFDFFHGSCQIGHDMATLIYFKDIDQGMAAMTHLSGAGITYFSRFTAHQFSGKDAPNFVPGNPQQTH